MTNALSEYYSSIAPYWEAEAACRDDLPGWVGLARDLGARAILDLGCGSGRVARVLGREARVVGVDLFRVLLPARPGFAFVQGDLRALPFGDATFDLAIAANDPFAHLLDDAGRERAVSEATRVAGRVVIDGLRLTAADAEAARGDGLVRERDLPGGIRRCEQWTALGGDRYRAAYRYVRNGATLSSATTDVRAWSLAEPALRRGGLRIAGGLDGRPYEESLTGLVVTIGEGEGPRPR